MRATTTVPSTMIAPLARSMPEVRMISVWPMASVPITTDCCSISEKFGALRKVSVVTEKTTMATSRAASGPATWVPRNPRARASTGVLTMTAGSASGRPRVPADSGFGC
ncbi:MAG: hypothetical protein QM804_18760 [Propionicimonas sp.]